MTENRRGARRTVFYYLEIIDMSNGSPLGRMGDISREGIMILTEKALPVRKNYRISIKLPPERVFPSETLNIEIRTMWTKPDVNPSLFCTGCSIIGALPEKDAVIARLIEFYGFNDQIRNDRK